MGLCRAYSSRSCVELVEFGKLEERWTDSHMVLYGAEGNCDQLGKASDDYSATDDDLDEEC